MSQVTIDLDDDTLEAARRAAARAGLSLSRWFAQFAEAEKSRFSSGNLEAAMEEIDRVHGTTGREDLAFPLDTGNRYAGLDTDAPCKAVDVDATLPGLASPVEQHDQALLAQRPMQDWFTRTLERRAELPADFEGLSDAELDAARSRYP